MAVVPPSSAIAFQFGGGLPLQRCAVRNTSADPSRRSVSETPAAAAAPLAAVTPGTIAKRNAGGAQRVHLFAGAAEDRAVAAFQPDDRLPGCAVLAQPPIDFLLRHLPLAVPLADAFDARGRRNQLENFRRQQIVVQHDVGLSENRAAPSASAAPDRPGPRQRDTPCRS